MSGYTERQWSTYGPLLQAHLLHAWDRLMRKAALAGGGKVRRPDIDSESIWKCFGPDVRPYSRLHGSGTCKTWRQPEDTQPCSVS